MRKNPDYQIIQEENPEVIRTASRCLGLLGVEDDLIEQEIAKFFLINDVSAFFENFIRYNSRLFETALRLRERNLGPLPLEDMYCEDGEDDEYEDEEYGEDEDDYAEGNQPAQICHPLIDEWLNSKQDAKFMLFAATLAEEIYGQMRDEKIDAFKHEEEQCPDDLLTKQLLAEAKDKFLERIEKLLHTQFKKPTNSSVLVAQSRLQHERLLQ